MSRARSRFVCQQCGHASPRWLGRCPDCEAWDSFVEEAAPATGGAARGRSASRATRGAAPATVVPLLAVEEEGLVPRLLARRVTRHLPGELQRSFARDRPELANADERVERRTVAQREAGRRRLALRGRHDCTEQHARGERTRNGE